VTIKENVLMRYQLLPALAFLALAGPSLAQAPSDHQQHHPGGTPAAQAQGQPPAQGQMPMGQTMQNMPEQCRAMMQSMPQTCMGMMQQMMSGGTMGGGTLDGRPVGFRGLRGHAGVSGPGRQHL